jgi:hypothetical protein
MLVLTILAVIVLLGTVFLVYFFVNLCRDSHKSPAVVFVEVLYGPAMDRGFCLQDIHQPQLLSHRPAGRDREEMDRGECQASPGDGC